MEEVEAVLSIAKVAEALGTVAILLTILYLFAQGNIMPRATLREFMQALEKQYEATLKQLIQSNTEEHAQLGRLVHDLNQTLRDLQETQSDCKVAQAILDAFRTLDEEGG